MKTKNKLVVLAAATLITTSSVFAQNANVDGSADAQLNGRPPRGPGPMGQIRQEFREDKQQAITELKQGIQDKRNWMHGSTTPGMATPTPWKNFKNDMRNMKEDMRGKMASLTDAQVSTIAAKLGITIDELKAKLSTGTPLGVIIGNKISKEDMQKILPMPKMGGMIGSSTATGTRMHFGERPQGFMNSIRNIFFGGPRNRGGEEGAEVSADVNVNAGGIGGFFKRLFNF